MVTCCLLCMCLTGPYLLCELYVTHQHVILIYDALCKKCIWLGLWLLTEGTLLGAFWESAFQVIILNLARIIFPFLLLKKFQYGVRFVLPYYANVIIINDLKKGNFSAVKGWAVYASTVQQSFLWRWKWTADKVQHGRLSHKQLLNKWSVAAVTEEMTFILIELSISGLGTSLVFYWLRLCTPNARGTGLIPCQGTSSHKPQQRWKTLYPTPKI